MDKSLQMNFLVGNTIVNRSSWENPKQLRKIKRWVTILIPTYSDQIRWPIGWNGITRIWEPAANNITYFEHQWCLDAYRTGIGRTDMIQKSDTQYKKK